MQPGGTDNFPAQFVDEKTGVIQRFETPAGRFFTEILPTGARTLLLGAKFGIPLFFLLGTAGLAVSPFLALGSFLFTLREAVDEMHGFQHDTIEPDETLSKSLRHVAKAAGMPGAPQVALDESRIAAMSASYDGKQSYLLLGLRKWTEPEFRSAAAHEITHWREGATRKKVIAEAFTRAANPLWLMEAAETRLPETAGFLLFVGGAALIGGALALGVFALPALALKAAAAYAACAFTDTAIKYAQARRHEKVCDRGAALMTGGRDLAETLAKVSQERTYLQNRRKKSFLKKTIFADHPSMKSRFRALQKFEHRYPEYCDARRAEFAALFNVAAGPAPANQNAAPRPLKVSVAP